MKGLRVKRKRAADQQRVKTDRKGNGRQGDTKEKKEKRE
jgi:hypothetical protein